eukprot:366506-Chlamydomonas_euryale.AAC.14
MQVAGKGNALSSEGVMRSVMKGRCAFSGKGDAHLLEWVICPWCQREGVTGRDGAKKGVLLAPGEESDVFGALACDLLLLDRCCVCTVSPWVWSGAWSRGRLPLYAASPLVWCLVQRPLSFGLVPGPEAVSPCAPPLLWSGAWSRGRLPLCSASSWPQTHTSVLSLPNHQTPWWLPRTRMRSTCALHKKALKEACLYVSCRIMQRVCERLNSGLESTYHIVQRCPHGQLPWRSQECGCAHVPWACRCRGRRACALGM